jgi:hypothetical protein
MLLALCGVVVFATLTGLLTAPAMAQPFWRSDLVCDLNDDGTFDDLGRDQRPFAQIAFPTGDLYVSRILGLLPNTDFVCDVICVGSPGFNRAPCGTTDANGTLKAQTLRRFASRVGLGLPLPSDVCVGVDFQLFTAVGPLQRCVEGFNP